MAFITVSGPVSDEDSKDGNLFRHSIAQCITYACKRDRQSLLRICNN